MPAAASGPSSATRSRAAGTTSRFHLQDGGRRRPLPERPQVRRLRLAGVQSLLFRGPAVSHRNSARCSSGSTRRVPTRSIDGGNNFFVGARGSVAFTDWLSVTVDEFGWDFMNPHNPQWAIRTQPTASRNSTWAPRSPSSAMTPAAPWRRSASSSRFPPAQPGLPGHHNLGLTPYFSIAQNFGRSPVRQLQLHEHRRLLARLRRRRAATSSTPASTSTMTSATSTKSIPSWSSTGPITPPTAPASPSTSKAAICSTSAPPPSTASMS